MALTDKLLPVTKVAELLGVSASTIWRWARTPGGSFPQPVRLSAGCTRRKTSEVTAFAAAGGEVPPDAASADRRAAA